MLEGRDSLTPPSAAVIQAAHGTGVIKIWSGGFAGPGIAYDYSDAEFKLILGGGLGSIAFCSGWADPLVMKARAAALGIVICLDVENGIRPDGDWVQGWLDASGAGLYGNAGVFVGRRAAFYILADYPRTGDPGGESWPSWVPRPSGLCGWQWAGTHLEFGINVDSTWFDDGFLGLFGGLPINHAEGNMPNLLLRASDKAIFIVGDVGARHILLGEWTAYQGAGAPIPPACSDAVIAAIPGSSAGVPLTPADEGLLQDAHAKLAALVASGTALTAAEQQQLQEAHDTILALAKTGTLTADQAQALQE